MDACGDVNGSNMLVAWTGLTLGHRRNLRRAAQRERNSSRPDGNSNLDLRRPDLSERSVHRVRRDRLPRGVGRRTYRAVTGQRVRRPCHRRGNGSRPAKHRHLDEPRRLRGISRRSIRRDELPGDVGGLPSSSAVQRRRVRRPGGADGHGARPERHRDRHGSGQQLGPGVGIRRVQLPRGVGCRSGRVEGERFASRSRGPGARSGRPRARPDGAERSEQACSRLRRRELPRRLAGLPLRRVGPLRRAADGAGRPSGWDGHCDLDRG